MDLSRGFFGILLLTLALNVFAQQTIGEECYRCEAWEYEARVEALGVEVLPMGRVYLIDRYHNRLKKYFISSEPTPSGVDGRALELDKNDKGLPAKITDSFVVSDEEVIDHFRVVRRSFLIDFWETQPSADELALFENFDDLAEELLNIHEPRGRASTINNVEIVLPRGAVDGVSSAHDVIGDQSLARTVGLWVINNRTDVIFWKQVLEDITGRFGIRYIASYEFNVKIVFPDGSFGFWDVDKITNSFDALFKTFTDSDMNPIPLTKSDLTSRIFRFGNGRESLNAQNMARRVIFLGGGVGEGPTGTGSCRLSCDSNNHCTFTCKLK